MAGKLQPLEPKFWAKVHKTDYCWLWTGAKDGKGYGQIRHNHKMYGAHRLTAYEFDLDAMDPKVKVDHRCHVPACVRPEHVRRGTQKQNLENLQGAHKDSSTGIRGVSWSTQRKLWRARVGHNYKEHIAGYFSTPEEAGEAAKQLRLQLHTANDKDRDNIV